MCHTLAPALIRTLASRILLEVIVMNVRPLHDRLIAIHEGRL